MMPEEAEPVTVAKPEDLDEDPWVTPCAQPDVMRETWSEIAGDLSRLVKATGVAADQVDDLLQDVFLAAWRQRDQFRDGLALRRWFYRVALNRAILEHRRRSRWQRVVRRLIRFWPSARPVHADAPFMSDEERRSVQQALNELSPNLRAVLMLRYFSQMNSKEIAEVLSVPDSTVRSRLRVARNRLAEVLRRTGYGDA